MIEYIQYTERRLITQPFEPTDDEHKLYEAVSDFLKREDTYALPHQQRHLTALILRKLLASSSRALAGTLEIMRDRLIALRDRQRRRPALPSGSLRTRRLTKSCSMNCSTATRRQPKVNPRL